MTPDQFGQLLFWAWVGGFCFSFAGALCGRVAYDFLFLFLRRSPAWRRFDRAMSRLFGRLNGGA